LLDCLATFLL